VSLVLIQTHTAAPLLPSADIQPATDAAPDCDSAPLLPSADTRTATHAALKPWNGVHPHFKRTGNRQIRLKSECSELETSDQRKPVYYGKALTVSASFRRVIKRKPVYYGKALTVSANRCTWERMLMIVT